MDITSANSILTIGVGSVFPTARQLQGFAEDDMYSMDPVQNAEVKMGADGHLSSGWVPTIKKMNITLQADSDSIAFFESWFAQEETFRQKFAAFGTLRQPAIGRFYTLSNGTLMDFAPIADGKKILQPRRFSISWEATPGAPA